MMRCINKAYQNSSYNANYIEVCNGTKLDMYIQHQRRQGETKTSYYFYITKTGATAPALPTAGNTSAWEAAIAVNRLLPPATRQRSELVDIELVSNPHQHDSRKRQLSPSSPCRSTSPPSTFSSSIAAKRTRRRCNQHGRLLNGGSSVAPSSSSSDDATSSPDDAVLASSEERGGEEASECMTNEVATMIESSEDTASSLASPRRPFLETYWDSPEAKLLFRPLASESTALDAIENQIKALRDVNKSSNAFLTVAGNLDELNEDDVTEHQNGLYNKSTISRPCTPPGEENMNGGRGKNVVRKRLVNYKGKD
ncbi:hypothetical protein MHU86_12378 [Fragilaria crotonensis]|nr:hypothetical protein MHU86_12378 [Fragilaria crotonensis]